MTNGRLAEFMKRVFTDEKFKRSFLSNPGKAMGDFGLGNRAKGAILSIGVMGVAGATDIAKDLAAIEPLQFW